MAKANTYPGPKSDKLFRNALMIAVKREVESGGSKKLQALADKLVEVGLSGDVRAIEEIADRLDGKVITIAGDAENPLALTITKIERVIIDETRREASKEIEGESVLLSVVDKIDDAQN